MKAIEDKFRQDGMTVPFTFNDPSTDDNFATGEGAVDIYGWDAYPLGFDCSHPTVWPNSDPTNYRSYHAGVNPDEPMALYEYQGKHLQNILSHMITANSHAFHILRRIIRSLGSMYRKHLSSFCGVSYLTF
jgi:hypothetical protein